MRWQIKALWNKIDGYIDKELKHWNISTSSK